LLSANCVCWSSTSMLSSIVCGNRGCLLFKMWGFFFYVRFWKRPKVHSSHLWFWNGSKGPFFRLAGSGNLRRVHSSYLRFWNGSKGSFFRGPTSGL
jgi:hypothetical protein